MTYLASNPPCLRPISRWVGLACWWVEIRVNPRARQEAEGWVEREGGLRRWVDGLGGLRGRVG